MSGASICLVNERSTSYGIEGSGLKPGTLFGVDLAGPHVVTPTGSPPTITVDADGHLPGAQGFVVPAGTGPVTVTIRATAGSGSPVVVTFTR